MHSTHIWHTLIPDLSDEVVQELSAKYDFSGGQIENIARHHAIDCILHGESQNVREALTRHCESKRLSGKGPQKIGF